MADKGILAIWHDVTADQRDDVLHWYNKEHHPERLCVPGFVSARRHIAIEGQPELFIAYEVESTDTLASAPYLERVNNPTPWTQRMMPNFRNNNRTVCRVSRHSGQGYGAFALTLRFEDGAVAGEEAADRAQICIDRFLEARGSVSGAFWEADLARTTINSDERRLRGVPDTVISAVLVLTASTPEAFEAVDTAPLAGLGEITRGLYRMDYIGISRTTG